MSSQVEYRQLGASGLRVSVPILGAMSFGSSQWAKWVLDEEKALELLKTAWDLGVTTIDTANIYSEGESERIIGKFIKQYNIPRERLVILSKCRYLVSDDVSKPVAHAPHLYLSRNYLNQGGLSRTAIFNQVDASLARLDTPYIDLLQMHNWDESVPIEETMRALHDLVQAGKVRYIGACNLKTWQMSEMNHVAEKNGWTKFISTQVEHSLLYRTEEPEMFEYCKHHGIGIIPYAPLLGGHLARPVSVETERKESEVGAPWEKKHSEADKQLIGRVEEVAKRNGWTMAQVALAWSASKTTSPIVGVNSPERLKEALISGKKLSEQDEKYLEELYVVRGRRF